MFLFGAANFWIGVGAGLALALTWNRYVHPWLAKESTIVLSGAKDELHKAIDAIKGKL